MTEIWKYIEGYEGKYQISNFGRVKSLNYNKTGKERLLKINFNSGYGIICLFNKNVRKYLYIHRLVAQAFLENPLNLPEVNHIDEDKTNNSVGNLEWCDSKYNNNHGTRIERMSKTQTNRKDQSIQIDQFTKSGIYVKTWLSTHDAERNGFSRKHIIECCKGIYKSHKGYIWKYHIESED